MWFPLKIYYDNLWIQWVVWLNYSGVRLLWGWFGTSSMYSFLLHNDNWVLGMYNGRLFVKEVPYFLVFCYCFSCINKIKASWDFVAHHHFVYTQTTLLCHFILKFCIFILRHVYILHVVDCTIDISIFIGPKEVFASFAWILSKSKFE